MSVCSTAVQLYFMSHFRSQSVRFDQSQLEADYFDERKIHKSKELEQLSKIYQPEDFDFEDFLEDEIIEIPDPPNLTPDTKR